VYIRPARKISITGHFFTFVICQLLTVAKQEKNLFISGCQSFSTLKIVNLSRHLIEIANKMQPCSRIYYFNVS
jgi:hypothetical protein